MALQCDAATLVKERDAARKDRDDHLCAIESMLRQYAGPAFDEKGQEESKSEPWPDNHAYEYVSLTTPKLVFNNPRVSMKTRRGRRFRHVAQAVEAAVNRWSVDRNIRKSLDALAYWHQFAFAAAMVYPEPRPGMNPEDIDAPRWPGVCVLSPRQFIFDPLCTTFEAARWVGHEYVVDKSYLLEQAKNPKSGWDAQVIEDLSTDDYLDELRPGSGNKGIDRDEVTVTEIWVPEYELPGYGSDRGYHGTIFTLIGAERNEGEDGGKKRAKWARKPRAFYGPRWGPYVRFGCYSVPDNPFPLSPLQATHAQAGELNAHAAAASRSATQYKKLVLVDQANDKLAKQLTDMPHNYVVPVKGLRKDEIIQVEIGGLTPQMLGAIEMLRDRLNRVSGLSDAARGNANSGATATADTIADESSKTKFDYIRQKFNDPVTMIFKTAAWYIFHDDRIVQPLGEDAEQAMQIEDPIYMGGSFDDGSAKFDDLELEIDVFSMPHVSDTMQQARALQKLQLVAQIMPMIPQTSSFYDWRAELEELGDAFNDRAFADKFNLEAAQQLGQQQQQQQQMGSMQGAPGGGQASLGPAVVGRQFAGRPLGRGAAPSNQVQKPMKGPTRAEGVSYAGS